VPTSREQRAASSTKVQLQASERESMGQCTWSRGVVRLLCEGTKEVATLFWTQVGLPPFGHPLITD
jgi:hypothetical protein